MSFLVPFEEDLALVGPFPDDETAEAFRQQYLEGYGVDIRQAVTPEDWMAVYESDQEDKSR